jgi:uncharacterized membrane protein YfcA
VFLCVLRGKKVCLSLEQTLILIVVGFLAGGFGSIAGVGGGIIITPVLVLFFHVPLPLAVAASLVAVIATSTAASSVHVERHVTDVRLAMTLELTTTIGAAIAAIVSAHINHRVIAVIFICFLLYSAYSMLRKELHENKQPSTDQSSWEPGEPYKIRNYPAGFGISLIAGSVSGLLGIGGGPIKVPAMYLIMGVPLRVATATSNFMIGVTAATSALVYYGRGDLRLDIAGPLVVGVFSGSLIGARLAPRVRTRAIAYLLIALMVYLSVQMGYKLATGGFQ